MHRGWGGGTYQEGWQGGLKPAHINAVSFGGLMGFFFGIHLTAITRSSLPPLSPDPKHAHTHTHAHVCTHTHAKRVNQLKVFPSFLI